MNRKLPIALCVTLVLCVILVVIAPVRLFAQEDITLAELAQRIVELAERVGSIEALFTSPAHARDLDGDHCLLGLNKAIRNEAFLKFKRQWGVWPDEDQIRIHYVTFSRQSGHMHIVYQADDFWPYTRVDEVWDGCTFLYATDWYTVE